jgi:ABC-type phosphate transport system substrate-binding protein
MASKQILNIITGLMLLICVSLSIDIKAQQHKADEFYIIGNSVDIKSASIKHIQSIFRGKYSSWNNRQTVIIVLPSRKNETCQNVSSFLYETSITGMQKYWLSQVFQGRSNPPVFLDTDKDIINYIEKNPGAIGIISRSNNDVKSALIINILN